MRFIYKLLLGLIIFNGMLVLLASMFPVYQPGAVDVTGDTDYAKFSSLSNPNMLWNMIIVGGAATLSTLVGVTVFGWFSRGISINALQVVGIASFIGAVTGLWFGVSQVFTAISSFADNQYFTGFYAIITICIGIIVAWSVIEMFIGQTGVDQ